MAIRRTVSLAVLMLASGMTPAFADMAAADLGRDFGATLTEAEIDYLMREEWAERAEDVLWRRSKLGLRLSAEQAAAVEELMQARRRNAVPRQASAGGRP